MDNELLLFDRLQVIKATNEKYDLENSAYLFQTGSINSFRRIFELISS